MTVDDDGGPRRGPVDLDAHFPLDRAVASLYADLRLTPMLHALLARTREMVDGVAGSISVIDRDAGTYRKVAERGVACQVGRTFPLTEGATGRAVDRGGPLVIEDYSAVTSRHLPPDHPANRGSVAAVPIWWRGELIGVNVAFAGRRQRFSAQEVDRLEVLTQTAAGAIVTAGAGDPTLARLLGGRAHRVRAGSAPRTPDPGLPPAPASVGCDGPSTDPGSAGALSAGTGDVGHGGLIARPPTTSPLRTTAPATGPLTTGPPTPSPLTTRETQVLALVARGLGDREIARRLVVSPKTVEKHVGAAIRKTGSTSRTGAAVVGLERGWILP